MEVKFFHSNSEVKKFLLTKFNFTSYFHSNQTTKMHRNPYFTSVKFLPPRFLPNQTKHKREAKGQYANQLYKRLVVNHII